MSCPLVAIPAYPPFSSARIDRFSNDAVIVPLPYVEALRRAGALEAILLPMPVEPRAAGALLDRYDGLLLIGGGDVDPAAYGQAPVDTVYDVSPERDACELVLARAAVKRGMPVLAICRGIQVLNVAMGGTLHQHISDARDLVPHGTPGSAGKAELHEVELDTGSRVADAVGTRLQLCSSHHHQAIDRLGDSLRVVGRAPDGLVEAVEPEDPRGPWVVGVQWHPEDTAATDPAQQALFDAFVDQAARRRV